MSRPSAAALLLMLSIAPATALPPPAVAAPPGTPAADAPALRPSSQALVSDPGAAPAATGPASAAAPGPAPAADADAAPGEAVPPWAAPLREEAKAVLAGEDFHQQKTSRDLVPRPWLRRLLDFDLSPDSPAPTLPDFALLAEFIKVLLVVLLALSLGWLLWRGREWLGPMLRRVRRPSAPAAPASRSLALPEAPLPPGIGAAARRAWQAGDAVLALSLLYRGAVRALEQQYRISLPASATEGECLRHARASGKAVVGAGFAPIVQAWVALAYARRAPTDFERLLTLYAQHFETPAEREARS